MDCLQIEELLSDYIENDLPEDDSRLISLHLKSCSECRLVKETMEEMIDIAPELQEEVPFYLKNRLYCIPESIEEDPSYKNSYFKWMAAMLGTILLFLNLFYFTNIYPQANYALHKMVAGIETFAVKTGAFIGKLKESKQGYFVSQDDSPAGNQLEGSEKAADSDEDKTQQGGQNG